MIQIFILTWKSVHPRHLQPRRAPDEGKSGESGGQSEELPSIWRSSPAVPEQSVGRGIKVHEIQIIGASVIVRYHVRVVAAEVL